MKLGHIILNLLRKAVNTASVPKGRDAPQIARQCCAEEKVLYTIFFYSKGIVLQKPCKVERASWQSAIETVISELNKYYKKFDQPHTWVESNFFMIIHLHTSQSCYKSISLRKTFKLCHTLPFSPDLAPCDFFLFPHLKKSLSRHK